MLLLVSPFVFGSPLALEVFNSLVTPEGRQSEMASAGILRAEVFVLMSFGLSRDRPASSSTRPDKQRGRIFCNVLSYAAMYHKYTRMYYILY